MPSVTRAVRRLWWRKGISAVLVAVAVVTTAAATLAPLYLDPATDTLLRAGLHRATVADLGIRISSAARRGAALDTLLAPARPSPLGAVAAAARGDAAGSVFYPDRIAGLRTAQTFPATGPGRPSAASVVTYRAAVCSHLRIVTGRCATRTGEAIVSAAAAGAAGWAVGTTLPLSAGGNGRAPLRVVGVYTPRRPADPYWLGVTLHPRDAVATPGLISVGPVFVNRGTLDHTWVTGPVKAASGRRVGTAVVTALPDGCTHLRFSAGHCPSGAGEVAISAATARRTGIGVGQSISVPVSPSGYLARVAGIYQPRRPGDQLWSEPGLRVSSQQATSAPTPTLDAVFTNERTLSEAALSVRSTLDLPLRSAAISADRIPQIEAAVQRVGALSAGHGSVRTRIGPILDRFHHDRQILRALVVLVGAQLTVLAWFVLYLLTSGSIEARGDEIALAKVRGHRAVRVVAFGMTEPVLLLTAAAPLGVALGWLVVLALTGSPARLGLPVLAAAGIAVVGGWCAVVLAGRRVLTRPVLEQWRRSGQRAGGPAVTPADGVVLALAAAGLYELQSNSTLQGGRSGAIALLGPALIAIAAATLGVRLLPLACRLAVRGSRGSGRVGRYVAVRQIARRPAGLRLVALLAVAVSLAFFTVDAATVAARDRSRRAALEVGADRVLTVSPNRRDLVGVVRGLDPGGRHAMAAAILPATSGDGTALLAVDSLRLTAVAPWSGSYGGPPVGDVAARLRPALPAPAQVTGRRVRLRVHVSSDNPPDSAQPAPAVLPDLRLTLRSGAGGTAATHTVRLGRLRFGDHVYAAAVTGCGAECRLTAVVVAPTARRSGRLAVLLESAEERVSSSGWRQISAGFGDSSLWAPTTGQAGVGYATDAGGFTLFLPPVNHGSITVSRQDRPSTLPVLVSRRTAARALDRAAVTNLDLAKVPAKAIGTAAVLPEVGARGELVDLSTAQAMVTRPAQAALATYQVWLNATAPADFANRLRAAGVSILGSRTIAGRLTELRRQAPALALRLFVLAALAAVLLAAASIATATYLSARRRAYELATLRAVAFEQGVLLRAALVEQLLLLGAGLLIGIGAGTAAVALSLRRVPLYSDRPPLPPNWAPDVAALTALVVVIAALSCAAAAVSAVFLVRAATPDRLREAAP